MRPAPACCTVRGVWTELSLGISLAAGGVRAAQLWRAHTDFRAVNVVVMRTLLEGRAQDLPTLLERSGPSFYTQVARDTVVPTDKLGGAGAELRERLRRDAQQACVQLAQRLKQGLWLELLTLFGIGSAAAALFFDSSRNGIAGVGLVAACLLLVSNQRASRSIASGALVGSSQLVDALTSNQQAIEAANQKFSEAD